MSHFQQFSSSFSLRTSDEVKHGFTQLWRTAHILNHQHIKATMESSLWRTGWSSIITGAI